MRTSFKVWWSVTPHPNADKLRVCQVNIGEKQPLSIVCGAPSVETGWRVPTATLGATLPGGLKIKKAKLRGVESQGMLCSEKELGLPETTDGLMVLPGDAPMGQDIRSYLQLDDVSIELSLTPNRGDCLGIVGIAREVGVINRCKVNRPSIPQVPASLTETFAVAIETPEDCPRYVGRVIRGINPQAQTPLWMRERLRRSDIRTVSPVVDITNYVLLELNQPMHAFDLDKLSGGIQVRKAVADEKITLLDGQEVTLKPDTLVIADHRGPQAMAGIMGGAESAVRNSTKNIFLESAYFTSHLISGRARSYGLHTDSSHRFERGIDPQSQLVAIERATALLLEIVGGQSGPVIDVCMQAQLPVQHPILLRTDRIRRLLGMEVSGSQIENILTRLEIQITPVEQGWQVIAPGFRPDITQEVDLIEEIARIHGYEKIPASQPIARLTMAEQSEAGTGVGDLRQVLVNRGYQEAITYSFVAPEIQSLLDPLVPPIALSNPISAEMSVMRTNLWPGLVQAMMYNFHRQQSRVRLFEYGLRFIAEGDDIKQEKVIAGVLSGNINPEQWGDSGRSIDFFDCKSDVEALLGLTGDLVSFQFVKREHAALHPGQSAVIQLGEKSVGWLGAIHPSIEQKLSLNSPTFVFEIALNAFDQGKIPKFQVLSQFPSIRRDIAIVVDQSISFSEVKDCVTDVAPYYLHNIHLFDVYVGKGIDSGRKSLALGLTFQDLNRTLNDLDVDSAVTEIIATLNHKLGATLRS